MSDSREIAARQPQGGALAEGGQAANIVGMLLEAGRDPTIDAGKVKAMAELAIQLQDRELQSAFNRSLNAAIMEMPTITKAGAIKIPAKDGRPERIQGHFAKFEDIDRICRPILAKHNLAIRFEIDSDGPLVTVRPIISHTNGFVERGGAMKVPLETSGSKNNVQAAGSSVSYAKRYGYCAALNIITEGVDDDGTGRGQVVMTHEREQLLMTDAEIACRAGDYPAFFALQSPKDRAYLIQTGFHAANGGKPLPSQSAKPKDEPKRDDPPADQGRAKQTAEEWLAEFKAWVDECQSRDDLERLEDRCKNALAKLRRDKIELGKEADRTITERRAEIDKADDERGGPADSQRGEGRDLYSDGD